MSLAIPGHGALMAIEIDPEMQPGVFTTVGELVGDLGVSLGRTSTEVTPHNESIDSYVPSAVMRREPWDLSVNHVYANATHAALRSHMHNRTTFGVRFRGPGSEGPTDEWIASGFLTNYRDMNPVREGVRSLELSFQPSGPMIIDGEVIT